MQTKTLPTKMRASPGNLLLAGMPAEDRLRLLGDRVPIDLRLSETLSEPGERARHVYFPIDSFVSLITPGTARAQLEIGLVGNEGMLGVPLLLGVNVSPCALSCRARVTRGEVDAAHFHPGASKAMPASVPHSIAIYMCSSSQLMQTATCTRFHLVEARLARWLLMSAIAPIRVSSTSRTNSWLTCLGVRRVGVTGAASALQRRKLIRYQPRRRLRFGRARARTRGLPVLRDRQENLLATFFPEKVRSVEACDQRGSGARRLAAQIAGAISC